MLKMQDVYLLKILEKVTIASNWQLMILAGYRDPSVVRKRINALIEQGYIKTDWLGWHKSYTLSQAGLSEMGMTRRPYEFKGIKSEHEEMVTEAACYLYIKTGISIMDMLFDHELNSLSRFKKIGHKPDIAFPEHEAFEVELNSKQTCSVGSKSGLEANFRNNAQNYDRQIWAVPSHKMGLKKRLKELAEYYNVTDRFAVFDIEEMKATVSDYDVSRNEKRMNHILGEPTPIYVPLPPKAVITKPKSGSSREVVLND